MSSLMDFVNEGLVDPGLDLGNGDGVVQNRGNLKAKEITTEAFRNILTEHKLLGERRAILEDISSADSICRGDAALIAGHFPGFESVVNLKEFTHFRTSINRQVSISYMTESIAASPIASMWSEGCKEILEQVTELSTVLKDKVIPRIKSLLEEYKPLVDKEKVANNKDLLYLRSRKEEGVEPTVDFRYVRLADGSFNGIINIPSDTAAKLNASAKAITDAFDTAGVALLFAGYGEINNFNEKGKTVDFNNFGILADDNVIGLANFLSGQSASVLEEYIRVFEAENEELAEYYSNVEEAEEGKVVEYSARVLELIIRQNKFSAFFFSVLNVVESAMPLVEFSHH